MKKWKICLFGEFGILFWILQDMGLVLGLVYSLRLWHIDLVFLFVVHVVAWRDRRLYSVYS